MKYNVKEIISGLGKVVAESYGPHPWKARLKIIIFFLIAYFLLVLITFMIGR